MRYTHSLDDLLGSQARLRILRYLCTAGGEHTGREIARAIGMGETPTHRALKELSDTMRAYLATRWRPAAALWDNLGADSPRKNWQLE